jgi:hypothetical protein
MVSLAGLFNKNSSLVVAFVIYKFIQKIVTNLVILMVVSEVYNDFYCDWRMTNNIQIWSHCVVLPKSDSNAQYT